MVKKYLEVDLEKIFQREKNKFYEGNGIGLSILKKIVELHNGNISVTSTNEITKFVIRLTIC